jgi:predicted small lipoprotein YifL
VQRPRHPFLPALAILLTAGVLGACGVKGELERPVAQASPSGSTAGSGSSGTAENSASGTKRVFYERSVILGASRDTEVIPTMPPREWEKKREAQPARKPQAATPGAHQQKPEPDKAFVLDWLL